MARIALWLALAALAAVPVRAAEETAESATTQALAHAARAKVHYDLGEYERAAEEYILVYRIKPRPGTLFNIAQSYRKAGQYGKAKQFYESYLRETPETKNRAVVEKAIKEIDGLLAKEKRAKDGPPQGVAQDRALAPPPTTTATVTPPALPSATDKPAAPSKTASTTLPPLPIVPPSATGLAPPSTQPSTPAPAGPPVTARPSSVAAASSPQPASAQAADTKSVASPASAHVPAAPGPRVSVAATTLSPPPAASQKSHMITWVAAGASVTALAAGGVFGAKTYSSRSLDDAHKANLLYGIGGGLAIVTGALFLFDF